MIVTGASKGFGRAIASALHAEGAKVVAVARNAELLASLNTELGGALTTVVADVTDPVVAGSLIERYRPDTLVLNAGAAPLCRPLQHHTWDTFSRPWEVDVRIDSAKIGWHQPRNLEVDDVSRRLWPGLVLVVRFRHRGSLRSRLDPCPK